MLLRCNIKLASVRALVLAAVVVSALLLTQDGPAHAQGIERAYAENGELAVITFTASDYEGTVVAWFLTGVDGGDFSINDGSLSFRRPPDYEFPTDDNRDNVYEASVNVTDGTTTTADLKISVTNVDEDGTVYLSSLQPEVSVPLTASLTDPDGGVSNVGWL